MRQFPNLPTSYSSDISVTHVNRLYACANFTLNLVRLRYWIPAGRQRVKKADQSRRHLQDDYRIAVQHPDPSLLPKKRLTQEEPFTVSDVDFTRALYIREAVAEKRDYIYFFTCLRADVSYFLCCTRYKCNKGNRRRLHAGNFFTRATTKVVYLVVVTDFSVQTFVLAHRGFAAERYVIMLLRTCQLLKRSPHCFHPKY